jgi:hypothetical protein
MENLEQKIEIKKNTNTDPKPHICYFNDDFESIVNIFFQKIKPMEGIVKYKMVAWDKFPVSVEEAKTIGLEWAKKFQSSTPYYDFKVSIYFHLTSKTIRFELKQKNSIIKLEPDDIVENKILSTTYILEKTIKFDCVRTKYFEEFNLEMCKQKGKELALGLESQYLNNKFIVFLNPSSKTIQITMK